MKDKVVIMPISSQKPAAAVPITQEELADLYMLLEIRSGADTAFMTKNIQVLSRLEAGSPVENGEFTYHRNLGVAKQSRKVSGI